MALCAGATTSRGAPSGPRRAPRGTLVVLSLTPRNDGAAAGGRALSAPSAAIAGRPRAPRRSRPPHGRSRYRGGDHRAAGLERVGGEWTERRARCFRTHCPTARSITPEGVCEGPAENRRRGLPRQQRRQPRAVDRVWGSPHASTEAGSLSPDIRRRARRAHRPRLRLAGPAVAPCRRGAQGEIDRHRRYRRPQAVSPGGVRPPSRR